MNGSPFFFEAKQLTVGYNGVPLVRDISFSLKRGEILTLIGPNGAGKTTVLRHIIRQLRPISGTILLSGRDLQTISGEALSQSLSVVLTERIHPELMTCEDVVAMGRYPYTGRFGVLSEQDRKTVRETMELVRVAEFAGQEFFTVSDGQRQRVMLARALCQEPEILVLDEPTSFLDIRYKMEFLSLLQKLSREKNLTVILSLHEVELAERISDKIACVRDGRIDRFGPPEEIFRPGYLSALYGMTMGSYDETRGSLELEAVKGTPKVFVLSGGGTGTGTFRRLQREGVPFASGILWENDLDYSPAKALAVKVLSVAPFSQVPKEMIEEAKRWINTCDTVLCTLPQEMWERNAALSELRLYAAAEGKLQENTQI